jgi:flagellin-like hook-associated protein FlgL
VLRTVPIDGASLAISESLRIEDLDLNIEHLTATASVIHDADVEKEVTGLKKQLLLVQTYSAMVGQSNLIPEGVQLLLQ